jgi:hypothetical protein
MVSDHWRDLVLFHEFFQRDPGKGLGASHQIGWTALAIRCEDVARRRTAWPTRKGVPNRSGGQVK